MNHVASYNTNDGAPITHSPFSSDQNSCCIVGDDLWIFSWKYLWNGYWRLWSMHHFSEETRITRTPAFWGYPPPPHDYSYYWVILDPKSNKVDRPGKYRSRAKVITCDIPSDANDDLCQTWKECKQNYRFFFKVKARKFAKNCAKI